MTWVRLLKRVFGIDVERRACGGKVKLIVVIEQPGATEKMLKHIGLDSPLLRAKAR